jgi:hypothetical protein
MWGIRACCCGKKPPVPPEPCAGNATWIEIVATYQCDLDDELIFVNWVAGCMPSGGDVFDYTTSAFLAEYIAAGEGNWIPCYIVAPNFFETRKLIKLTPAEWEDLPFHDDPVPPMCEGSETCVTTDYFAEYLNAFAGGVEPIDAPETSPVPSEDCCE